MKNIFTILLLFLSIILHGENPDSLNLRQCLDLSIEQLPFRTMENASLDVESARKIISGSGWYPNLSLNASANFQSEVITVPIGLPNFDIPSPPKDQYDVYLEVRQTIYDAGLTQAKLQVDLLSEQIHRNEIDITKRSVRSTTAEVFYAILLIRSQEDVLSLAGEVLHEQHTTLQALYGDGVIPYRDLLEIEAAIITWKQHMISLKAAEAKGLASLTVLTGITVDTSTVLSTGDLPLVAPGSAFTPEMRSFELREMQLEATALLSERNCYPKASLFGRAGFGRPGLNMFSDDFNDYYLAGIGVTWSPWDWGQSRSERLISELRVQEIKAGYDIYKNNLSVREAALLTEMQKYPGLIQQADTLIIIHENIMEASEAALLNGTITAAEYLADHNAHVKAMLERRHYIIESEKSIVNYLLLTGKL